MAMALAVAFVACQAATPAKPAEPEQGPQGPPGESPGHGPTTIGEVSVAVSLAASGPMASMEIDLAEHFHDPDGAAGETLTYQHASDDAAVATSAVAGNTLTITAAAAGNATISVTAMDKDELKSPTKKFKVTVTPAVAPMVKAGGIGDQTLYLADGAMNIVLTTSEGSEEGYFTHSSDISYAVSADPTGYVEASEANGTLTLKPLLEGTTRVTIVATADSESTDPVTFRVTVKPDSKPVPQAVAPTVKAGGIGDQTLYLDAAAGMAIVLTTSEGSDKGYFTHASAITYTISSSPEGVVGTKEANGTLTLTPLVTGPTRVSVVATADGMSTAPVIFTVTVEASKPTPPPPPPPDIPEAPMTNGTIPDQEVEAGDTETVDASMYFTPDTGLTFSVGDSDDDDVATATVDATSGMVTIKGVKVGEATITVTATNAAGSRNQDINVRVTPEGIPHIDDLNGMVEIVGVGDDDKTMDIRIDVGQTLQSLSDKVDADRNPTKSTDTYNVWTITGNEKTEDNPVKVRIWGENRSHDGDITVTVNNTPPKKMDDDDLPSSIISVSNGTAVTSGGTDTGRHVTINEKDVYAPTTADGVISPTDPGAEKRLYHVANVDFSDYFDDADGFPSDIAENGYRASSNEPDVKVVGMPKVGGVAIDVTRTITGGFPLEIYVMDDEGESEPVTVIVGKTDIDPIPDIYEVNQVADTTGGFSSQDVWLREDAKHTLTFADYADEDNDTHSGFRFVELFTTKLVAETADADVNVTAFTGAADDVEFNAPDPAPDPNILAAVAVTPPYYTVTAKGPIELDKTATDDGLKSFDATATVADPPTLMFKVTGIGRATVTITYHVAVARDKEYGDGDGNIEDGEWKYESTPKVLTLNIVPSS